MICPVCNQVFVKLVNHHDHFGDFCRNLIYKHSYTLSTPDEQRNPNDTTKSSWRFVEKWAGTSSVKLNPTTSEITFEFNDQYKFWSTFENTDICTACNSICADVKRKIYYIPKPVSFSPCEMKLLLDKGITLTVVKNIWHTKQETYRPRFHKLLEIGIVPSEMVKAWKDRTTNPNSTHAIRVQMLQRLHRCSPDVKSLCNNSGNEREIARLLKDEGWPRHILMSFIFWYHKKHGDPGCKNNELGIGQMNFRDWFCALAEGDKIKAQKIVDKDRYWRNFYENRRPHVFR